MRRIDPEKLIDEIDNEDEAIHDSYDLSEDSVQILSIIHRHYKKMIIQQEKKQYEGDSKRVRYTMFPNSIVCPHCHTLFGKNAQKWMYCPECGSFNAAEVKDK